MKHSYVIKNKNGNYIGVDYNSGGYHFDTENIQSAKIWPDKESAYNYKQLFPNEQWTLHILIINTAASRWF